MFSEFLKSDFFTAKYLATPWEKVLKLQWEGGGYPQSVINTARRLDFDNLPVVRGDKVLGYVPVNKLSGRRLTESVICPYEKSQIDPNLSLPRLAEKLATESIGDYPLYFVVDGNSRPIGIMTAADLNRKTPYIYSYTLILFLEQWVRNLIADRYQMGNRKLDDRWLECLKGVPSRRWKSRKDMLIHLAKKRRTSPLAVCELKDLLHVFRTDSTFSKERSQIENSILEAALEFRNVIAHPTDLLVPGKGLVEKLRNIAIFWDKMGQFVGRNDSNMRNSGWPVEV